jgi:hypothetical protein
VGPIRRWTRGEPGWPVDARLRRTDSLGEVGTPLDIVELIDDKGVPVLAIPTAHWMPVLLVFSVVHDRMPADPLVTSGLTALLELLGVRMQRSKASARAARPAIQARTDPVFPMTATVFMGLAAVGTAVGLVLGLVNSAPTWLILTGAGSILALGGCQLALYVLAALRELRTRPRPTADLRPRPSVPVTRRFLQCARLSVVGQELCLVDGLGQERWLGLGTTGYSVAKIALVKGHADGMPIHGVELRGRREVLFAYLPADHWLGDNEALDALEALGVAAGIPVSHEENVRRRSGVPPNTVSSRDGGGLFGPPHPWPGVRMPVGLSFLAALFAAILAETGRTDLPARLSLVLLILVAAAGLLCALVVWLGGRAWLDRRVRPKAGR